jgi:hypothetical protein
MQFTYLALLDRFSSDTDELDLSYENITLRIRKIPRKEIADFLLRSESLIPFVKQQFEIAIEFSDDMYWMVYYLEVEDSREAMVRASNAVDEEIQKILLALRLFKEGCIRIVFDVKKGRHIATMLTSFKWLSTTERVYLLKKSEIPILKDFLEEFSMIAWEKKESKTPLSIALNRFTDGYERTRLEDKVIDYVVGLEALYLRGEAPGEFGYKMSHRASVLLSDNMEKQREIFEAVKKSYTLRSKIVHGKKYVLTYEDVWFIEDILRDSIKEFLKIPKPNWLNLIFAKN